MRRSVASVMVLVLSILAVLSTTAVAQPGAPQPPPPPPPNWQPAPVPPAPQLQGFKREKRYPLKVALADAASVSAMLVGAVMLIDNSDDGDFEGGFVLIIGGAIGLFVGSPLVHLSQDNGSSAWKALALRLGVPMVLGALSNASGGNDPDSTGDGDDVFASLTGVAFLGAIIVDYAILAKVDVMEQGYVPYAMPLRDGDGGVVGLSGRF